MLPKIVIRLNFFIAIAMTTVGLAWFIAVQRRGGEPPATMASPSLAR